jgi:hypothetical protein
VRALEGHRYFAHLAVKKWKKILKFSLLSSLIILADEQFLKTRACSGQIGLGRRKFVDVVILSIVFTVALWISVSGETGRFRMRFFKVYRPCSKPTLSEISTGRCVQLMVQLSLYHVVFEGVIKMQGSFLHVACIFELPSRRRR